MKVEMKTVTTEVVEKIVSEDGQFVRYVDSNSEESIENAKKRVKEYEESALAAMSKIVLGIKHLYFTGGCWKAEYVIPQDRCNEDSEIYVFAPKSVDDVKNIMTWCELKSVRNVSFCIENGKNPDGSVKWVTADSGFDVNKYVGKEFIVEFDYDDYCSIYGSLEDVQNYRNICKAKFEEEWNKITEEGDKNE